MTCTYGEYDGLFPISALMASRPDQELKLTLAIYLQKPPSVPGRYPQERHLFRCTAVPSMVLNAFLARRSTATKKQSLLLFVQQVEPLFHCEVR